MDRIDKLKTFLQANPDDAFLKHALALEYVKLGDEAGARNLFEEILARDPLYVGSYYHLGKLLERVGQPAEALDWYEKGMAAARQAGDRHALGELQGAYDDLADV
ncbi:tetratricopeptide repeat protein [Paraflavitalea pollutisoli]|uniref:tetratricopeptide repeat protein n=1 Tax=Paraflavitalea pollutisoli TaxID=3034143 RepID=UPI0023EAFD8A|nr:tetratricopeptide repeat protein [Paraflavitalea sp. H1-2-19X]